MVVLTVGTNSWVTLAYAAAYFEAKFGAAAWALLSALEQMQLLITAFNWIQQQSTLSIPATSTAEIVKQAQCEAAWFIYRYFEDYEKNRALAVSGVKSWKVLDAAATLTDVAFPGFLSDMLTGYSTETGHAFPLVSRDLEDNASE